MLLSLLFGKTCGETENLGGGPLRELPRLNTGRNFNVTDRVDNLYYARRSASRKYYYDVVISNVPSRRPVFTVSKMTPVFTVHGPCWQKALSLQCFLTTLPVDTGTRYTLPVFTGVQNDNRVSVHPCSRPVTRVVCCEPKG